MFLTITRTKTTTTTARDETKQRAVKLNDARGWYGRGSSATIQKNHHHRHRADGGWEEYGWRMTGCVASGHSARLV